ncbi:hypothetical protein [Hydrogenimonas sp.]
MKIAIDCRSTLLEKSLRKFLQGMLAPEPSCDIVVSDHAPATEKPVLRIGTDDEADLHKPFSRSQLMIKLEEKLQHEKSRELTRAFSVEEEEESLEEKVEWAARRFVEEVVALVKEHYEKRP